MRNILIKLFQGSVHIPIGKKYLHIPKLAIITLIGFALLFFYPMTGKIIFFSPTIIIIYFYICPLNREEVEKHFPEQLKKFDENKALKDLEK